VIYASFRDVQERLARFVGDVDPASPRGKKRRRILEAATELFVTYGYRKTNIDEIAKAAGIAKGTVYLYFATKAEVLLAAVSYEKQRSLSLLSGIFDANASARERLRRCVKAMLLMVASSPLLTRAAADPQDFSSALAELAPDLVDVAREKEESYQLFASLLDEAVLPHRLSAKGREERITALLAITHLAPLVRSEHVRQGMSIDRFVEVMASLVVDGLSFVPDPADRR
jgi:TetR/AcrR family transcriptional regulator, fatty acid metabolism regulator protein